MVPVVDEQLFRHRPVHQVCPKTTKQGGTHGIDVVPVIHPALINGGFHQLPFTVAHRVRHGATVGRWLRQQHISQLAVARHHEIREPLQFKYKVGVLGIHQFYMERTGFPLAHVEPVALHRIKRQQSRVHVIRHPQISIVERVARTEITVQERTVGIAERSQVGIDLQSVGPAKNNAGHTRGLLEWKPPRHRHSEWPYHLPAYRRPWLGVHIPAIHIHPMPKPLLPHHDNALR